MRPLLLNVMLALIWVQLSGEFNGANFVAGFLFGFVLILLFQRTLFPDSSYHLKIFQAAYFLLYFIYQLILANVRVAIEVITPKLYMTPAIVAVPLDIDSDIEITVLANLITLTPGTLSLDVSPDKKYLYVHAMYVDDKDEFIDSIKDGFEKRVMELFS